MSKKTVTMVLPSKVVIHDEHHAMHSFGPGICEVPEKFADHWYLKNSGAKAYDPQAEIKRLQQEADEAALKAKIETAKVELEEAEKSGDAAKIKAAEGKLAKLQK